MAKEVAPHNPNQNHVDLKEGASHDGQLILRVLQVSIADDETNYLCLMEDGTKQVVSAEAMLELRS